MKAEKICDKIAFMNVNDVQNKKKIDKNGNHKAK
jgi:hypothetical protein